MNKLNARRRINGGLYKHELSSKPRETPCTKSKKMAVSHGTTSMFVSLCELTKITDTIQNPAADRVVGFDSRQRWYFSLLDGSQCLPVVHLASYPFATGGPHKGNVTFIRQEFFSWG